MKNPPPGEPAVAELADRLVRGPADCDQVETDTRLRAEWQAGGRARIGTESCRVLLLLPRAETVSVAAHRKIAEPAGKRLIVAALDLPPRHSAPNGGDDP